MISKIFINRNQSNIINGGVMRLMGKCEAEMKDGILAIELQNLQCKPCAYSYNIDSSTLQMRKT